ncbi:MAG TPA: hypothetical protein DEA55_04285 [Rhodospirillaceae bacterium]|nr:hypothetical protein [Rhodospirillaceae bacterium]
MPGQIIAIEFDKTKFRHSPYTQHNAPIDEGGVTFYTYRDHITPTIRSHVVSFDDDADFEAVALGASGPCVLFVSLSGYKADPNLDFIINNQKHSIKASDYVIGYIEHMRSVAPPELLQRVADEPNILDDFEKEWSIPFFKERLSNLIRGTNVFFHCLYKGIDNAMGDTQRSLIIFSDGLSNKASLGSYDIVKEDSPELRM